MNIFLAPQPLHADTHSEADSQATEHTSQDTESNAEGEATERATKRRRGNHMAKGAVPQGDATEHTDYLEDCDDEAFPR